MKLHLFALLYAGSIYVWPISAQADIYKGVDADGHVTYSSTPIKGGKKIILEPLPTMLPPSSKARTPDNFPKVDSATQKGRDDTRFMILQNELTAEQKILEAAKQRLDEAQANPEVFMGQDGKTHRNVVKYEEKVKPLQDEVDLHQRNVDALNTELSKLR